MSRIASPEANAAGHAGAHLAPDHADRHPLRDPMLDAFHEHDALAELGGRFADAMAHVRGLTLNDVLRVERVTFDATGFYLLQSKVAFASVTVLNLGSTGAVTIVDRTPEGQIPLVGVGVGRIDAGGQATLPMAGTAATIYGVAGQSCTVVLWARVMPPSGDAPSTPSAPSSATAAANTAVQVAYPAVAGQSHRVTGLVCSWSGLFEAVQTVANPAAGADWSTTVPAGHSWQLLAVRALLTTSVAVANRFPALIATDGAGHTLYTLPGGIAETASLAFINTWAAGAVFQNTTSQISAALPGGLVLPAGYTIGTNTLNLQAADQWSQIVVTVLDTVTGLVSVVDGTGTIFAADVPLALNAPLMVPLPPGGIAGAMGSAVTVTLAAAGAGAVGKLNVSKVTG